MNGYPPPPSGYGQPPPRVQQGTQYGGAPQGGAPAPMGGCLPAGWEQAVDPGSGKTFYFNRQLNQTSWTPPDASAGGAPAPAPAPVQQASPGGLPQGWEMSTDPGSGKTFYFNRALNQTSWDPPAM